MSSESMFDGTRDGEMLGKDLELNYKGLKVLVCPWQRCDTDILQLHPESLLPCYAYLLPLQIHVDPLVKESLSLLPKIRL